MTGHRHAWWFDILEGRLSSRSRPLGAFAGTPWAQHGEPRWRRHMWKPSDQRTGPLHPRDQRRPPELHCPLEADNPRTDRRCAGASVRNDSGRHHGRQAQAGRGAIYALYRGEIFRSCSGHHDSECDHAFSPDGRSAISPTTASNVLYRVALDPRPLPRGTPEVLLRHPRAGAARRPVVDADAGSGTHLGRRLCRRLQSARRTPALLAGPARHRVCPAFVGRSCPAAGHVSPGRTWTSGARGRSDTGAPSSMEVAARAVG